MPRLQLDGRGQVLRLVVPHDSLITEVISITGLDEAVPISSTGEQAIEGPP